jgi:hypothetical protein
MRSILLIAVLPAFLGAAPALQIVRPVVSMMDGGTPDAPGYEHIPGETLFFSCRIAGYSKSAEEQIHLSYSVQAFDPKGVPLTELFQNELKDEVTPQDKEWMPKVATEVLIPPLVASGTYQIVVKAQDLLAKTSAELSVPFQVRGHALEPSETLTVQNLRFYREEDDPEALEKAVYRPGDGVWARFDITGFRYGPNNKIDVSYVTSLITASGKVLWTQPEPAVEQTESFYPKRYVPATMGITLQKNFQPGEYTITIQAKDGVGNQTFDAKSTFRVE